MPYLPGSCIRILYLGQIISLNCPKMIGHTLPKRLIPSKAILLVCDIQDKFAPKGYKADGVIQSSTMMCEVAKLFDIPVLVTQQNPPVFGKTYQPIISAIQGLDVMHIPKTTFSMINEDTTPFLQKHKERTQAIIVGMETQICVQQTFLDLASRIPENQIKSEYDVFLPVDCITSLRPGDRSAAISRMQSSGGVISTFQGLAFQMLVDYKSDKFKPLLNILKKYKRENLIPHL